MYFKKLVTIKEGMQSKIFELKITSLETFKKLSNIFR